MKGRLFFASNEDADWYKRTYDYPELIDVTDSVQRLYDLVVGSMDWGSGFVCDDDVIIIAKLAQLCELNGWDTSQAVARDIQHKKDEAEWRAPPDAEWDGEHEHVWSSVNRCMWPGCGVEEL